MMKTTRLILAAILLSAASLYAQPPAPGGISGAAMWLHTRTDGSRNTLYNEVGNRPLVQQKSSATLNGNPAISLSGNDTLPSVPLASPDRFTFVAVYRQADTLEHALFSLQDSSGTALLATAARLADLQESDYLNYPTAKQQGIYLYTQRKNGDSINVQNLMLRIARKPQEKLPVTDYKGEVPEAVLYNRVLTLSERQRVQSYLSLKYGISLEQEPFPNSYYNASGDEIWNATRLSTHSTHITGIGRDDLSGLLQAQSTNTAEPMLHLGMKDGQTLADNSFLLWGDNNRSLRMAKQQGMPARLERQWMTQTIGQMGGIATSLKLSTVHFEELLEKGKTYWLAVDRSATGRYPAQQTDYYKCDAYEKSELRFDRLKWNTPNAVFTVLQAPDFFVRTELVQPQCQTGKEGSITLVCVGGQAPYRMVLEKNGQLLKQQETADSLFSFDHLAAARYCLSVTDSRGKTYHDTLYLSHIDAPAIQLASTYQLKNGEVELDAKSMYASGASQFSWEKSGQVVGTSPILRATTAGTYTLTVENNSGCSSFAQTNVQAEAHSHIKSLLLYPNPITSGSRFYIRIQLTKPSPVTITMYDVQGKLVRQKTLKENAEFHVYEGQETRIGVFLIGVQAAGEAQTLKLIVQ